MFSTLPTPASASKPHVDIYDAYIDRHLRFARLGGEWEHTRHLYGKTYDYPVDHMDFPGCVTPGKEIVTSPIIRHDGDLVETERTIYHVKSWSPKQNKGNPETRSLPNDHLSKLSLPG